MTRLRRSMLFIPGSNAAMLSTAFGYRPDSIMFDLEDAVALREKDSARLLVFHAIRNPVYRGIETVVRINPLNAAFGLKDLEAAVRAGAEVIRLPKTDSPEDVRRLEETVQLIERECGREPGATRLMAAIESASGVVNAVTIATASRRMMGIALAGFDYVVDMQTERGDGTELFYARCAVLHAARAARIDAFDVVFGNINDEAGFVKEAELAKRLGFNGKSLINPRQIELLHNVYAPSAQDVADAGQVVAAAEQAEREGLGVVSLNGRMVDAPIINRARRVLQLAERSGVRTERPGSGPGFQRQRGHRVGRDHDGRFGRPLRRGGQRAFGHRGGPADPQPDSHRGAAGEALTGKGAPMPSPGPPAAFRAVGLAEVLANREARVAWQRSVLARWKVPIVSLTLVLPGPHKDSPDSRFLLEAAARALDGLLAERGWPALLAEARFNPTGPEAVRAVAADPLELKRALTELEANHPLGRLWDLDVICPTRGGIPRRTLGLPPRSCLLCARPAHACARSRAHPLPSLLAAVDALIQAYRVHT